MSRRIHTGTRLFFTVVAAVLTLYASVLLSLLLVPADRGLGPVRTLAGLTCAAAVAIFVWSQARSAQKQLAIGAVMLALVASIPLWGYWRTTRSGDLYVTVHDVALANDRQLSGWVTAGDLVFRDVAGRVLATGTADSRMTHPTLGDCRAEEERGGAAWQTCFAGQSRWLMTWVRDARRAAVRLDSCTIENVPVAVEESRDQWWLWWVPHPHLDNSTRTHFRVRLWIDSANCTPAVPRY